MCYKISIVLSLLILFIACNSESKELISKKGTTSNNDEYYLSTSTQSIDGLVKSIKLNDKIYLSYRFIHRYDTSGNLKVDKSLFLGEPTDYGHYSDKLDTIILQVRNETKKLVDSLSDAYKNRKYGDENDPFSLPMAKELLNSPDSIRTYAESIYENIQQSKKQGTHPIYYSGNSHYNTRSPKFSVQYNLQFVDKDGFEITSFTTEEFHIVPYHENIIEGKIDVSYKNLSDFRNEIFDKAAKVFVVIKSVHL